MCGGNADPSENSTTYSSKKTLTYKALPALDASARHETPKLKEGKRGSDMAKRILLFWGLLGLLVLAVLSLVGGLAYAENPKALAWNENTNPAIAGYRLYEGTVSGGYGGIPLQDCPVPCDGYTFPEGHAYGEYFWVVTAYDSDNESGYSNEVTDTFSIPPPTGCTLTY
jgi:hypothetical protein